MNIYRFKIDIGDKLNVNKLSKDPFEDYLCKFTLTLTIQIAVQLSETSFIVFTDLDLPQLIPIGETCTIEESKGSKIICCKLFSY